MIGCLRPGRPSEGGPGVANGASYHNGNATKTSQLGDGKENAPMIISVLRREIGEYSGEPERASIYFRVSL